jgi:hypothetical protein
MKVVMTFDFSDDDRVALVAYRRSYYSQTGLPKLATREMCRDFIRQALENQWLALGDQLSPEAVNDD